VSLAIGGVSQSRTKDGTVIIKDRPVTPSSPDSSHSTRETADEKDKSANESEAILPEDVAESKEAASKRRKTITFGNVADKTHKTQSRERGTTIAAPPALAPPVLGEVVEMKQLDNHQK
jgi:hypothetical protein